MPKPITYAEAAKEVSDQISEEVFEAFNELIVENLSGSGEARITLRETKDRVLDKLSAPGLFKTRWMDIEPHYRAAGWKVEFDRPAYNETYEAFYVFSRG